MADDFESSDFRGIRYVQSDGEAFIVIANFHDTNSLWCIVGQAFQVESVDGILLSSKLSSYIKVPADTSLTASSMRCMSLSVGAEAKA